jgi:hypothetical protein
MTKKSFKVFPEPFNHFYFHIFGIYVPGIFIYNTLKILIFISVIFRKCILPNDR